MGRSGPSPTEDARGDVETVAQMDTINGQTLSKEAAVLGRPCLFHATGNPGSLMGTFILLPKLTMTMEKLAPADGRQETSSSAVFNDLRGGLSA